VFVSIAPEDTAIGNLRLWRPEEFRQYYLSAIGISDSDENISSATVEMINKFHWEYKQLGHRARHPFRHGYRQSGFPKKRIGKSKGTMVDWLMFDLLRNLSNTSCQLRQELGTAFWKRSCIDIHSGLPEEEWMGSEWIDSNCPLVSFFEDRPAIWPGVKEIRTYLYLDDPTEENKENFINVCSFVAQNLQLESFEMVIHMREDDGLDLSKGAGRYNYLTALRTLAVTLHFNLDLDLDVYFLSEELFPGWDVWDWECDYVRREKVCDVLKPLIKELLMPDSLRPSAPKTEAEKYMSSRNALALKE